MESWTLTTLHTISFCRKMSNILKYIQVAPATTDVQSILEIPATDEIHMKDQNHGLPTTTTTLLTLTLDRN